MTDSIVKLGSAELLFRCAQEMSLQPAWIKPGGLFAISIDGRERYINSGRSSLNSHVGISLTGNKYLTRLILDRYNMRNIPFARPHTQEEAALFLDAHTKIIAKPTSGSGSRDIHIVTDVAQLQALVITRYILEKYITGQEIRYLVLHGAVIAVHRSEYGTSIQADRPLQRISYPQAEWDKTLVASSLQIVHALDLAFAAVDYMIDDTGQAYVLEVNSAPGLKWFHAPSTGPKVDVARMLLEAAVAGYDTTVETSPASSANRVALAAHR